MTAADTDVSHPDVPVPVVEPGPTMTQTLEPTGLTSSRLAATPSQCGPPPPLHKCITLPWALHVDPLPSLHYQAVPCAPDEALEEDARSLDDEDTLGYEQPHSSVIGNNVRLQPLVIQPPAHDLETISFLLEASKAREAISPLVQLFRLLLKADDDPHFANLIAFFDTRYSIKTGRLEGDAALTHEEGNESSSPRKGGRLSRMVSRTRRSRAPSNSASMLGRSASVSLGQSGKMLSTSSAAEGSVLEEEEEEAEEKRESMVSDSMSAYAPSSPKRPTSPFASPLEPPRQAPHLLVALRSDPSKLRSIAFPIRLDLQNAGKGLCPHPPLPAKTQSGVSAYEVRPMSPSSHQGQPLRGTEPEPTLSSGLANNLRRMVSPDSIKSDFSHVSSSHSGGDVAEPQQGRKNKLRTNSIASTQDPHTRPGYGTAMKMSIGESRSRRPSALQRFLGLGKGRRRGASEGSTALDSDLGGEIEKEADQTEARGDADLPIEHLQSTRDGVAPMSVKPILLQDAFTDKLHLAETLHSEHSETILDGQVESSKVGPILVPVQKSVPTDEPSPEWAGSNLEGDGHDSFDFLSLMRCAAETALSLPSGLSDTARDKHSSSEKAKGKRPQQPQHRQSPAASPNDSQSPSNDVEQDMRLDAEAFENNIFARCRRGETSEEDEPWFPSGSSDPLPIAIFAALGPSLGWTGVLQLCYGEQSPGALHGELSALGKAAALAAGQANEAHTLSQSRPQRTFADWQRLMHSFSRWAELYEVTRIRAGLSREIGLDVASSPADNGVTSAARAQYSLSSGTIPAEVVADASDRQHAYRRRMGIPEGLPATEDGIELGDYRWSRQKLGPASAATALTLLASSLAHYFTSMAGADFTHESGWELDYLEALVLKSPIIAERFPPPSSRVVSAASHPFDQSEESQALAQKRARPCPNPHVDGSFDVSEWSAWVTKSLQTGSVITPAVSVQAWWAIIAILNEGSTGLNLQILNQGENWKDVARDAAEAEAEGAPETAIYV